MSMLSLHQCLEQVAALGTDYLLTDNQGLEWTATGLLASLTRDHPDRLGLSFYLRLPDPQQDGAIYQVTETRLYPPISHSPFPCLSACGHLGLLPGNR